jgi:HEAT repeat protein
MRTSHPETEFHQEQAARQVVAALVGTVKKINLYSESHSVYYRALKNVKNIFDVYFSRFGNFRIQILRNKIIHDNETVYEGNSGPFDLAFLLHRDGILWLEFQNDLELYEIDTFFRILRDHGLLAEEPEDDIVTALWEFNLPSIAYEVVDSELDYQDDLNFEAGSGKRAQNRAGEEDEAHVQNESIYPNVATLMLSTPCKDDPWQLSAEERQQLRDMIAAEEKLDGSDYVMDALLYILEEHPCEEDIEALLETLVQEFREILANARFTYLLQTFEKLKKIANRHARLKWMKPHLETLFESLSSRPFLNGLLKISVDVHDLDDTQFEALRSLLMMLDPSAILDLAPIARNIRSVELRHLLMDAIRFMAASDFGPLERLIAESEADQFIGIVFVLGVLKDWRSRQTLINLLRHPSEQVRMQALKTLMTRDHQAINEIFPLIDDPNERIQAFVLKRLGRRRCEVVEDKILQYLKAYRYGEKKADHFFAVCRTLGKCGSERSIPYLSQLLFRWPMMGVLRPAGSPLRKGAVAALRALRTKKAAMLLERHQWGFFRNVLRSVPRSSFGKEAGRFQNAK